MRAYRGPGQREVDTELKEHVERAEAELRDGRFADAFTTYQRGIVALVVPVSPMPRRPSTPRTPNAFGETGTRWRR